MFDESHPTEPIVFEPQPGPQTTFTETEADIAIIGGSVGGGKTFGVYLETFGNLENSGFRALVLRRQSVDITQTGGIWDGSEDIYPLFGGKANHNSLTWTFPSGCKIAFSHMNDAKKDHLRYKSAQIPLIVFEELTEFEEHQFWYMFSRNRSTCGIRPYVRATTNPEPGWVADLLIAGGYVCPKTGYAIEEMSGVIRYIIRDGDNIVWFDSEAESRAEYPDQRPLSFTFIRAKLDDNPKLTEKDPDYLSKVQVLGRVERQRLLEGNWIIKPAAGLYFKREWWHTAHRLPRAGFTKLVRAWDLAGSKAKTGEKPQPTKLDYVAGVLMGMTADKQFYILDLKHFKGTPAQVRERVEATAQADQEQWGRVTQRIPQDPGQAGVDQMDSYSKLLSGFRVKFVRPTGSKITRAEPFSSQVEAGNVFLMYAAWNEPLITEAEQFPDGAHDDIVDAASDAFNELAGRKPGSFNR